MPPLTVKCAFHYVQNPRYGTRTRHLGDETEFVTRLNEIWEPQANIKFEQVAPARDVPMTEDLGDAIDTDAKFNVALASARAVLAARAGQDHEPEQEISVVTLVGLRLNLAHKEDVELGTQAPKRSTQRTTSNAALPTELTKPPCAHVPRGTMPITARKMLNEN